MSAKIRFVLGFLIGLILTACAFLLAGAGHGTYAPLVAAASFLAFVPILGIFGTPFLWAIYYAVIPAIDSRLRRVFVLAFIVLLHLVPAVSLAFEDPAFNRQLEQHVYMLGFDGLMLFAAFIILTVLSSVVRAAETT